MAVVFDKSLGSVETTVTGTTQALTTTNAVATGGFIVLMVGWFGTGTLSSVAGGSLTWTIDKQTKNGSVGIAIVSAQAPAGLASGTAITATYSATSTSRTVAGVSFTGAATSTPVDTSNNASATTTTWTTGSVTTTNASDLVVGAVMGDSSGGATSTPTSGWTEQFDITDATAGDSWSLVYQIVSATGSYNPGGTWTASRQNAGVTVAYKAAAASGTTYTKTGAGVSPLTGGAAKAIQRTKTGLGVSSFVGSGSKQVVGAGITYTKTGKGVMGLASTTYVKSGTGISAFVGSGSETRATTNTITKTGKGVMGIVVNVRAKTGSATSAFVGSGSKVKVTGNVITKTGKGVMGAIGTTYTKTGSGISTFNGSGGKVKANGTVYAKTGGGDGGANASIPKGLLLVLTGIGGFRGSGSKVVVSSTRTKSGNAISAFKGSGSKVVTRAGVRRQRIYMVI